ncbi:MAG: helix-turn-helix transcriptional regulator [Bacteroidales bacterium]|nr:helix-turn-helix transcriptional regulator [Bacteroidales bacterium]
MNLPLWSHQQGDTILLDMRSGLSESRVRSIRQMPDGRIAIATTTTIDIFDGTRFYAFHLPPDGAYPLPEYMGNRQMNCDSLGYIWLRNKQTLYVLDSRHGRVVSDVKGLMRERGITNNDVARWPTAPPPPTPLTWEGVFRDETVTAYTHDQYGGLWIGTKDYGILYINPRRSHQFTTSNTAFPHEPRPIFCSPRASRLSARLAPSGTNCSYEESERYLYIGTLNGLLVVDSRDSIVATISETDGLKTNNVAAIGPDRRGDIWMTTAGGGISRIQVVGRDSFEIVNYGLIDGISTEGREFQNGHIHTDSDGRMAVGFVGGMVTFHPDSLASVKRYAFHIPRVQMAVDHETEPTEDHSPWWYWLLLIPVVAGAGFWYMRNRRKPESSIAAKPTPTTASDATVERLKNIETPSQDEQFLKKLHQAVEQNIDNEDFSVQQLSEEMAMDRTVLYRRMQSLDLGTPSAHIKRIRMEVAARLLKETGLPVNEIALRTGFSNPKYFSITFKQEFGKSPKAFREE